MFNEPPKFAHGKAPKHCYFIVKGEECLKSVKARGLCSTHWQRWYKHGDASLTFCDRGEVSINRDGYAVTTIAGKTEYEHRILAEKALGKPLPFGTIVHHVTEHRSDNHGSFKLVICPDQAYHLHIHKLMKEKGISFKTGWPNEETLNG